MKAFNLLLCAAGLLVGLLTSPGYAQKGKISRFLTKQANNEAFTKALQHAQAAAAVRSANLNAAISAVQAKGFSQTAPSRSAASGTKGTLVLKDAQQRLKDLEEFIQTYQRFPKKRFGQSARESVIALWADHFIRKSSMKDPIAKRIFQLHRQYSTTPSKKKNGKSPQQWLDELETFIQQNGHYPRSIERHSPESRLFFGVAQALSRLETDDPIALRMRQLRKEYPVELAINRGKNPQEWLDELEKFIEKYGRYPSNRKQFPEEQAIYQGISSALSYLETNDPIAVRIRQIKEQYPRVTPVNENRPKQTLEELEQFIQANGHYPFSSDKYPDEKRLRARILRVIHQLDENDPIIKRIYQLRKEHSTPVNETRFKQRLAELEAFIEKNGRYPKQILSDEDARLYANIRYMMATLSTDDPIVIRIRQLREQYPPAHRPKTPQQWLDALELFIQKNKRYPKQTESLEERALYSSIGSLARKLGPEDPISQRILQLRLEYPSAVQEARMQERLDELEAFIWENGRYPSQQNPGKEQRLYANILTLVNSLGKEHPVSQRILQLRQDYPAADRQKTPRLWLNELETFIQKTGRYPSQQELGKEHWLYANTQALVIRLGGTHPISQRILQLQQQYLAE